MLLCWNPTLKAKPFFGSKTAATPAPFAARPSIGLLTSASLMNCVVSSLAPALRSK